MRGTFGACVERFLSLPQHHQQNCTLTIEGTRGNWGPASIRAYVAVHGVPPQMGRVPPDKLKQLTKKQLPTAGPFKGKPAVVRCSWRVQVGGSMVDTDLDGMPLPIPD